MSSHNDQDRETDDLLEMETCSAGVGRDFEACRTAFLLDEFSTCLLNDRNCEFSVPFGYVYLCRHPLHRSFKK